MKEKNIFGAASIGQESIKRGKVVYISEKENVLGTFRACFVGCNDGGTVQKWKIQPLHVFIKFKVLNPVSNDK